MTAGRARSALPSRLPAFRSARLRDLARQVEGSGTSGRTDPENVVLTKLAAAEQMRALARELDAAGGMP